MKEIKYTDKNHEFLRRYRGKIMGYEVYLDKYIEFFLKEKKDSVEWINATFLDPDYEIRVCLLKFIDEYYGFENFAEKYITEYVKDEDVRRCVFDEDGFNENDIFYLIIKWKIEADSNIILKGREVKEKWKSGKIRIIDHPKNNDECIFEIEKDDGEVTQVDTW